MRITGLQISNFKVIKAINIVPDKNMVVISGANGAGKSSTLDAVWAAIAGASALKDTPQPIREGQTQAEVVVTTEKYKITRKWTEKGSYISVEGIGKAGQLMKPQSILDSLYSDLTFDPLEFARQGPQMQREVLLKAAHLQVPLDDLDSKQRTIFDERTGVNRDIKLLEGQVAGAAEAMKTMLPPPKEKINLVQANANLSHATAVLAKRERDNAEYKENAAQIKALTERNEQLVKLYTGFVAPDVDALQKELNQAQELNNSFAENVRFKDLSKALDDKRNESNVLTQQITILEDEKKALLTSSKMPIPGVTFSDDAVLINGIPFSQLSSAQKLKVSCAIAMAARPELRIIRIMDGSLLDSENLRALEEMAKEKDYQIFMEIVDEGGKRGIVIEEGEVKAINSPNAV